MGGVEGRKLGAFTFAWSSGSPVAKLVENWLLYHTHTQKSVSCVPPCCRPALGKIESVQ